MMAVNPRISGRRGQTLDLNATFIHNGVPADPYAIRLIEIYRAAVLPHNLVASIPVLEPYDVLYPAPLERELVNAAVGACGTEPDDDAVKPGVFHLYYDVPTDFTVPDVYFDVWYYYATNPCGDFGTDHTDGTEITECALDSEEYETLRLSSCHRFWLYPDEWFINDGLQTIRFGFEPLDQKFNSPEVRPLEIGLMPLPLYDYDFNLVNPLIPFLTATITVETQHCETLVDDEPMTIGLRQGSYRANPWVLKWLVTTTRFLKGTYRYYVTLHLPDGTTRVSRKFSLVIW